MLKLSSLYRADKGEIKERHRVENGGDDPGHSLFKQPLDSLLSSLFVSLSLTRDDATVVSPHLSESPCSCG